MAEARQRILMTGATGVVGRALVPQLAGRGHTVHGLVRSEASAERLRSLGGVPERGDVLDRDSVFAAAERARPDVVMHQATALAGAIGDAKKMAEAIKPTNRIRTEGTRNLLDAAERSGARRVVAQSIAFAYASEGPWLLAEDAPLQTAGPGVAIAELERAVMASPLDGVVLRYGWFYGPGTGLSPDGEMATLARRRRLPVIGSGEGRMSLVHTDDVAAATLTALDSGAGIYNVCDDHPAPAREWVPAFCAAIGAPKPLRVPAWLGRIAGGEMAVAMMTAQRGASNAKAKAELGWTPLHPDWRAGFATLGR